MAARVATTRRPMRRPFTVVHNWAALLADVTAHEPAKLLLADVDPAVAGWHADAATLRDGFARIETMLHDALPQDGVLVWTTDSTRIADQLGDPPHFTQAGNRLLLGAVSLATPGALPMPRI